jgi:hypothetical protein
MDTSTSLNIVDIPLEIMQFLCNLISYVDVMSLRWTCSKLSKLNMPSFKDIFVSRLYKLLFLYEDIKPIIDPSGYENIKNKITKQLSEYGYETHENYKIIADNINDMIKLRYNICEEIYKSGACVSGSFILDCLYNTNYHNDIDIYDLTDDVNGSFSFTFGLGDLKFTQFLYTSGFRFIGFNEDLGRIDTGYIRKYIPYEIKPDAHLDIKKLRLHKCENCNNYNSHVIQIIPIRVKKTDIDKFPIRKFIDSTFDLDICKNYFNGRELYVRSWKKLIYKYDYIKINIRDLVYVEYGTVDAQCWLCDNEKCICPFDELKIKYFDEKITDIRMAKYIKRGFNIKVHPQQQEMYNLFVPILNENVSKIKHIENGTINLNNFYIE